MAAEQGADQENDQQDEHDLPPRIVKVHRSPFLNVIDGQLLLKGQVEGVENKMVAERVHEKGSNRGSQGYE